MASVRGWGSVVLAMGLLAPPAVAQEPSLRSVPQAWGTYAAPGQCAGIPRVVINAGAVTLYTSAGMRSFPHPALSWDFNGREDHDLTVMVNGNGDGLLITLDTAAHPRDMSFDGAAPWTPQEQAIVHAKLRKCPTGK